MIGSSRLPGLMLALLAGLSSACGGSSSESPPPLPPHALNEPYRMRPAVQPPGSASVVEADDAADERPAPARPAEGPGRTTWGSNTPEPLPELAPK